MDTLLIDNGHGYDTPGKCSPLLENGTRLNEWSWTRDIAIRIQQICEKHGINGVRLVPEDIDIPLSERATRANAYIKAHPKDRCILVSIHANASGNGEWMPARGWEAWTTVGKTNSDEFAECLYRMAAGLFPVGTKIRKDTTDGDSDKEKDFTLLLKANCPAVLTENFFMDNREDNKYMISETGKYDIAYMHMMAAKLYFKGLYGSKKH